MQRIKAKELLEDPDYISKLTLEGYYDLLIAAGYSEETARKSTSKLGWNRLVAGESM